MQFSSVNITAVRFTIGNLIQLFTISLQFLSVYKHLQASTISVWFNFKFRINLLGTLGAYFNSYFNCARGVLTARLISLSVSLA